MPMLPQRIPPPSKGGPATFENDEMLPRLPLPSLAETAKRMAEIAAPFAESASELENFVAQINAEVASPDSTSNRAQRLLEQRHESTVNYVDEWWTKYAYLVGREPLPPIEASTLMFPSFQGKGISQARRTAMLMHYLTRVYLIFTTSRWQQTAFLAYHSRCGSTRRS